MTSSPALIRVAVDTDALVSPHMTLDALAERTEAALREAFPHTPVQVTTADITNGGFVRIYEDGGEYGLIESMDDMLDMRVRHVVGQAWERYADEGIKAEAAALLADEPTVDAMTAEAADLVAGWARLLTLPPGHPDRAEARALFAAQAGLGVGASPPSAPGTEPKTPQQARLGDSYWRASAQSGE